MKSSDLIRRTIDQIAKNTLRYLAAHGYRTAEDYGASVGVRDGGELPDVPAVPKVYGLPGVSSKILRGQPVLVVFQRGDGGAPLVAMYPAGCAAEELTLDATTVIKLVSSTPGVVSVGPGVTQPVAMAVPVQAIQTALAAFASAVGSAGAGPPATLPQVVAAVIAIAGAGATLAGALAAVTTVPSTRLKAV